MKTIFVLAAILAYSSARVYLPVGHGGQSVTANQGAVALGGVGSTVVAAGTDNAAASRVKREPQYYNGYPGYGNYAPQNVNANQASNAYGGPGSTVVATGNANGYGKRWKRSPQGYGYPNYGYPGYGYTGYGYGGYRPQTVTANQASNAVGGAGSTVVASGSSIAGAERVKREPQYYNGYPGYGYGQYGGYRPQTVTANQASNAVGGYGSNVIADGNANAYGNRWKRSPQGYGYPSYGYPGYGYPGYGYGGYRPQTVTANQESNAVGGAGSTVVASGTSTAGAERVKREPQYYYGYPGYGYGQYGGYRPQTVTANQASNAIGGAGSNVVAAGTSNAVAQREKRGYPPYAYPGYGYGYGQYGGYAPQSVSANQASNAVGGAGSTVVASGTSNAGGSKLTGGAYPGYPAGPYIPNNYGAITPQSVTANQISNAAGGDGSTVVSSGTSNAGGSMAEA